MNDLNNYMWCKEIQQYNISDPFLRLVTEKYKDEVPWENIVNDEKSLIEYIQNVKLIELRQKVTYDGYLLNIPDSSFFVSPVTLDPLSLENELYYASEDDRSYWGPYLDDYKSYESDESSFWRGKFSKEQWEQNCLELAANEMSIFINRKKSDAFIEWLDQLSLVYSENPAFQLLISASIFDQFGFGVIRLIYPPHFNFLDEIMYLIKQNLLSPDDNLALGYIQRIKS